jgi:sigma-B regulation protein RsbU (phosphoserine phosphatase)
MVSIQNSFEVQTYYKLKFLTKPFNYKDFIEGVDEMCPAVQEEVEVKLGGEEGKHELSAEMKSELNRARDIQRNLMPAKFPNLPGYEVHAFYKSCDEIGGDYYDVFMIDEDHAGLLIADVSGHGISGAMVMVMVRSAIRTWANSTTSPRELLTKVNPLIVRNILPGMFVTVYYAVLDMKKKTLTCSCSGHNPSVHWPYKTKKSYMTPKGGMPLGIVGGKAYEMTLKEDVLPLGKGDYFVFYTDGMVETMSPEQEEFTEERFLQTIDKLGIQPPDTFVKQLVYAVISHQSTAPQHDDLTMLTLRCVV